MEEKKIKKKTLTLSTSPKKNYSAPHFKQSSGKTSVVIEKKKVRKWPEKKFHSQGNFRKPKPADNLFKKKPPINKNYDIRK